MALKEKCERRVLVCFLKMSSLVFGSLHLLLLCLIFFLKYFHILALDSGETGSWCPLCGSPSSTHLQETRALPGSAQQGHGSSPTWASSLTLVLSLRNHNWSRGGAIITLLGTTVRGKLVLNIPLGYYYIK